MTGGNVAAEAARLQHIHSPTTPTAPAKSRSVFSSLAGNHLSGVLPVGSPAGTPSSTGRRNSTTSPPRSHRAPTAVATNANVQQGLDSARAGLGSPTRQQYHHEGGTPPLPSYRLVQHGADSSARQAQDMQAMEEEIPGAATLRAARRETHTLPPREGFAQAPTWSFPLARPDTGKPPVWPFPAAMPPATLPAADIAAVFTGDSDGGNDLTLIDQYLSLLTGQQSHTGPDLVGALLKGDPYANLRSLGLDRASLEKQGVAHHHINRLHHMLHVNAMAYAKGMAAEQRRLAILLANKEAVPMADRLLAYLTGCEASLLDDPAAPATQGPGAQGTLPGRWQTGVVSSTTAGGVPSTLEGSTGGSSSTSRQGSPLRMTSRAPDISVTPVDPSDVTRPAEETMDLEEIVSMAAAGNVVGLRRLLQRYRQMHVAVRQRLEERLKHETSRAARMQDSAEVSHQECRVVKQQLEEQDVALDNTQAQLHQLELALAAEREVVIAERAVNESLRDEIAHLEAEWSAQQAEAVQRVTEQLEALQGQAEGQLDLREQYLERVKDVVMLQLRYDHEARKATRLAAELHAARLAWDAAAAEAAALKEWRGRLENRAEAAEGWAVATKASVAEVAAHLSRERAAHRRTQEQLYQVAHKTEEARCAAADIHARASLKIRSLSVEVTELREQQLRLERALQEAKDVVKIRSFEAEGAKAGQKAARDQLERVLNEFQKQQDSHIKKDQTIASLKDQLALASIKTQSAEAELSDTKAQLLAVQGDVVQQQATLTDLQEFIDNKGEHEASLASAQSELQTLREEHAALLELAAGLEVEVERLRVKEAELAELQETYRSITDIRAQLSEVTQERDRLREQVSDLSDQLAEVRAELLRERAALEVTRSELERSQEAVAAGKETVTRLQALLQSTRDELHTETLALLEAKKEIKELKKLDDVVRSHRSEIYDLQSRLKDALAARVAANVDRQWYTGARQKLQGGLKQFLATAGREAGALRELCEKVQGGMAALEGSMLALSPEHAPREGEPSPLVTQDAEVARGLGSDLAELTSRLSALLTAEAEARVEVEEQVASLEAGQDQRLAGASEFWRDSLEAAQRNPGALRSYMVTANVTAGFMDSTSPLAQLLPVGLLEYQVVELNTLKQQLGELQAGIRAAQAATEAAQSTLAAERTAADMRQQHYTSLVAALRDQSSHLTQQLASARGARVLAEHMAMSTARKLSESEYQVIKAREREHTLGLHGTVPMQRVDRGVQTVYSELHMYRPPTTMAEAVRRAPRPGGTPTWGGDLGSGTVPMPPALQSPPPSPPPTAAAAAASMGMLVAPPPQLSGTVLATSRPSTPGGLGGTLHNMAGGIATSGAAAGSPVVGVAAGGGTTGPVPPIVLLPPTSAPEAVHPHPTAVQEQYKSTPQGAPHVPEYVGGGYTIRSSTGDLGAAYLSSYFSSLHEAAAAMPGSVLQRTSPGSGTTPRVMSLNGALVKPTFSRPSTAASTSTSVPPKGGPGYGAAVLASRPASAMPRQQGILVSSRGSHPLPGALFNSLPPTRPGTAGTVSSAAVHSTTGDPGSPVPTQRPVPRAWSASTSTASEVSPGSRPRTARPHATSALQQGAGLQEAPVLEDDEGESFGDESVVEDTGDDGGDLEGVSVREQYTESNGATGYASTAVQVEAVEQQKQHESQLPLLEQQHQDWIFTQQAAASAELKPWDWLKEGTSLLAVHGGTGHQGRQYTGGLLQPWSLQETMDVIADVYRAKALSDQSTGLASDLLSFIGSYLDAAYSPLHGPRPVQAAAQLVASVRLHGEGVYEVRAFGREAGIIAAPTLQVMTTATTAAMQPSLLSTPPTASSLASPLSAAAAAARNGAAASSPAAGAGGAWAEPGSTGSNTGGNTSSAGRALVRAQSAGGQGSGAAAAAALRSGGALQSPPPRPGTASSSSRLSRRQTGHQGGANELALSPVNSRSAPFPLTPKRRPATALPLSQGAAAASRSPGGVGASLSRAASVPASSASAHQSSQPAPPMVAEMLSEAQVHGGADGWHPLEEPLMCGEVDDAMAGLGDVPGTRDVVRFVGQGLPMDHLSLSDLGLPVLEVMAPEFHYHLSEAARLLGLDLCPDVFLHPALPYLPAPTPPVLLLHLPHVSNASLVAALAPVVDSGRNSGDYAQLQQQQGGGHSRGGSGSPARSRHSPRLLDGTFGWRRRAVLLVHPALLNVPPGPPAVPGSMFEQHLAALQSSGSTSGVAGNTFRAGLSTSPTAQPGQIQGNTRDGGLGGTSPGLQPASGSVPLSFTPAEQQALLAMALAPMCLSGGGGWRLDVSSRGGGGQQLYNGAGKAALQSPQSPSVSAGNAGVGPGEKLAVADAVTVITLADVAPLTLVPHLPVQLQVKWGHVYRSLLRVPSACVPLGDRAALMVVQALEPCVTAIWKSLVLMHHPTLVTPSASPSHSPSPPSVTVPTSPTPARSASPSILQYGAQMAPGSHGSPQPKPQIACPPASQLIAWAREADARAASGRGPPLPPLLDMSVPLDQVGAPPSSPQHLVGLAFARILALVGWAGDHMHLWSPAVGSPTLSPDSKAKRRSSNKAVGVGSRPSSSPIQQAGVAGRAASATTSPAGPAAAAQGTGITAAGLRQDDSSEAVSAWATGSPREALAAGMEGATKAARPQQHRIPRSTR